MLTAALDAARLGARAPLSAGLLRAAAPGYCTSAQQAEAPDNWFEQALAYATEKLHGAAAALSPAAAGMGQVAGYTAADYLIQHATRERRSARVPASTWDAIVSHIRDPADAARLADSARDRLLYCYAIPLYHHAADAGDGYAAGRLAGLLGRARGPGRAARPRRRRRRDAAGRLAGLLAERGDLDELRARADAGDRDAAWRLAELLAERGDLDELRARADAGDGYAAWRLAELLAERGDLDEAVQVLRARADAGDGPAAGQLAELLAERGDLDGLRARADAGDGSAAWRLAELLAERGDLDGAMQVLRARADAGDGPAAGQLAELLAGRGDLDELRARADAGDGTPPRGWPGCSRSAGTWTGCAPGPTPATGTPPGGWPGCWRARGPGRAARPRRRRRRVRRRAAGRAAGRSAGTWTELRARADAGDGYAAWRLAGLLAERGDLDELRARADAGDGYAAARLAGLLGERGDLDGAGRSCAPAPTPATGPPPGGWPSCSPSAGTWTGSLRARADAGDGDAAGRLAELLAGARDLEGACAPAPTPATGSRRAAGRDADKAGQERGSGAVASVRPELGRVNCLSVNPAPLTPRLAAVIYRRPTQRFRPIRDNGPLPLIIRVLSCGNGVCGRPDSRALSLTPISMQLIRPHPCRSLTRAWGICPGQPVGPMQGRLRSLSRSRCHEVADRYAMGGQRLRALPGNSQDRILYA